MKFDPIEAGRFTRSVSEYTRQMEELMASRNPAPGRPYGITTYHQACDRIRELRAFVTDIRKSKSERSPVFAELRALENFWGIESVDYN